MTDEQPGPAIPRPASPQSGESPTGAARGGDGPTDAVPPGIPFRARELRVPGLGEGAPGRRSRARTDTGRVVRASDSAPRRAADLHLPATITAAAPHQRSRGRVGPGLRLRPDDLRAAAAGGSRGQPGAVRRRRVRLDGRAVPDVRGQRGGAVPAARRLPAPGQGRAGQLPGRRSGAGAAADVQRAGRPGPAGRAAHRRAHPAGRRAAALPRGAAGGAAAGPAAPPAARAAHRRPGHRGRPRRRRPGARRLPGGRPARRPTAWPPSWSTASPARSGSAWPPGWPRPPTPPWSPVADLSADRVSGVVHAARAA